LIRQTRGVPAEPNNPELTDAVTLRAMTASEFQAWEGYALEYYARARAEADGLPVDVSLDNARTQLATLLPDGHATEGMRLLIIEDETGTDVGSMWLGEDSERPDTMFVWVVSIREAFRGRGLGRAAMIAAERLASASGVGAMSLNVFGANTTARRLYESLGYEVTSVQMAKYLRG
jgi:ribosomal protein S18 acetylase RimI-like enzyme